MVFGSPKQRDIAPDVSREDGMRFAAEVIAEVADELEATTASTSAWSRSRPPRPTS